MEKELKLKNGRTLKVTFEFAQGLSKEEGQRRIEEVYDVILKAGKGNKQQKNDEAEHLAN
jgi:hypothetical protein